MNFQKTLLLAAVLGIVTLMPLVFGTDQVQAFNAQSTVVPNCGTIGNMCTVCDTVALAMNIISFFVFFSVVVAALLFVNAGVLYIFSPANPGNIARAHKLFMSALVGLIIILAAWLIIDFIMRALYNQGNWGPWNQILCSGGSAQSNLATSTAAATTTSNICNDPVALAQSYNYNYNGGPISVVTPVLQGSINCYRNNVAQYFQDPATALGTVYTYEITNPLCNITRGNSVCGPCAHVVNSTHYGNTCSGVGAMGADFNTTSGSLATEADLKQAMLQVQSSGVCPGTRIWGNYTDHTHMDLLPWIQAGNSC